jgi:hypothetical protein
MIFPIYNNCSAVITTVFWQARPIAEAPFSGFHFTAESRKHLYLPCKFEYFQLLLQKYIKYFV